MKKLLIEEVRNKQPNSIPIWFMRQAGRYLKEYREEKEKHECFLSMCLNSDLMKEITLQPLRRFNLDAAIIFSDILIVPFAMGLELNFIKGEGPVFLENYEKRIEKLQKGIDTSSIYKKVYEGIEKVRKEIEIKHQEKAIIGFAGSPFTVACYVIQGRGSRDFNEVRKLYFNEREKFIKIIELITEETKKYLKGQIDQGVEVVKLFDSWAGILAEEEFEELVIRPTRNIVEELRDYKKDIIINTFPRGAGVKYEDFVKKVETDIIAIDHTVPIEWAKEKLQKSATIQGNLDNVILTTQSFDLKRKVIKILDTFSKGRFIFNMGHGMLPESRVEEVEKLISVVKEYER
ncbi:uroporphyrinogen decarboxylase [Candidatus Bandiella numerosa]|uniref:uroporphyrinogen decarboxylase n=1 Tax=Candidatus Bandiella numerosa TaxID=2570586 RepID=UPI001EFF70DE|nr:uroporphyrinogen decarboxylase [Candidatus Bandiella numerosa]